MSTTTNRRITLTARPVGAPKPSDFAAVDEPVPAPGDGEMLLRTVYLSLDPYMRGRMNDVKSYVPPVQLGDTMEGGAVSVVEESRHPKFSAGDVVFGYTGWQQFSISNGKGMRIIPDFARDVSGWLREGSIVYREDVVDGIDNAVEAFLGLLRGENFGKLVVKISDDPTVRG